jgi:hypothetical protein
MGDACVARTEIDVYKRWGRIAGAKAGGSETRPYNARQFIEARLTFDEGIFMPCLM